MDCLTLDRQPYALAYTTPSAYYWHAHVCCPRMGHALHQLGFLKAGARDALGAAFFYSLAGGVPGWRQLPHRGAKAALEGILNTSDAILTHEEANTSSNSKHGGKKKKKKLTKQEK